MLSEVVTPLYGPFRFLFISDVLHIEMCFVVLCATGQVISIPGASVSSPLKVALPFCSDIAILSFTCLGDVRIEFSLYNSFQKYCLELQILKTFLF